MLSALLLLAAAVWIPGTIMMVVHLRRAPVAVENESGFHVVEAPAAEDSAPLGLKHAA